MKRQRSTRLLCAALPLWVACADVAQAATPAANPATPVFEHWRETRHAREDDLLTAGLGIDALRSASAPAFVDPTQPTASEGRRRAIWSNWRGIADLTPSGGFGDHYGNLKYAPGREFSAYARVAGAQHPHRVLLQIPDTFDSRRPCVVAAASSGSRGIYGAIAVAGSWGLGKGCAVAYTDKGTGSDYFDMDAGVGFLPDGSASGKGALAFVPTPAMDAHGIAFKHAHSTDNPEADWGQHLLQALQFGLQALDRAYPQAAPFTPANTRTLGVGVSNGGGAALRAAELDGDWFDAIVAGEPNVSVAGAPALFDFVTHAALLMPCALLAVDDLPQPPLHAPLTSAGTQRCTLLKAEGMVNGDEATAQAVSARQQLVDAGMPEGALRAAAFSTGLDLWRSIAVTYASAYGRFGPEAHPCGYRFAASDADGKPMPATAEGRALWWSEGSGIPPGSGIALIDARANDAGASPLQGLQCLRALGSSESTAGRRVRAGIAEAATGAPRRGLPIVVIHGADDGLVPIRLTSDRYVPMARKAGAEVTYWRVQNAQHFDSLLAFPDYRRRFVPLLPYMFAAMDQVWAHLVDASHPFPRDADIQPTPRGESPLSHAQLAIPVAPGD